MFNFFWLLTYMRTAHEIAEYDNEFDDIQHVRNFYYNYFRPRV